MPKNARYERVFGKLKDYGNDRPNHKGSNHVAILMKNGGKILSKGFNHERSRHAGLLMASTHAEFDCLKRYRSQCEKQPKGLFS